MTRIEWQILGPVATELHEQFPEMWDALRYQTQFGPESQSFPYFPAALDFEGPAIESVHSLPTTKKAILLEEWVSSHRYVSVTPPDAILDRYAIVVVDILVNRAKTAGGRMSSF